MELFILALNNGGTTLLHQLLATSPWVAALPTEGQFLPSWRGPNPIRLGVKHIYTAKEAVFADPANYDWPAIKKDWYAKWDQHNPRARVRLQKSPTDLARVAMLQREFPGARFIVMARNPYAVVDGILRGNPAATIEQAAAHVLRCLVLCREAAENVTGSLAITYEKLTDDTAATASKIVAWLPELERLDGRRGFFVKGRTAPISNMNRQQIANLSAAQRETARAIFAAGADVLRYWGYDDGL
jgi:hypothetical protein